MAGEGNNEVTFKLWQDCADMPIPEDLRKAPDGTRLLAPWEVENLTEDELDKHNKEWVEKYDSPDTGYAYAVLRLNTYIENHKRVPEKIVPDTLQETDTPWDYFGQQTSPETIKKVQGELKNVGCVPDLYPKVADLGAGGAPFAKLVLIPAGWKPEDICNIDIVVPKVNPVPGTKWFNWDLAALNHAVSGRWPIPEDVDKYKGTFDLVSMTSAYAPLVMNLNTCSQFLLRKGGLIYQQGLGGQFLGDKSVWERVSSEIYRKK